MVSYWDKYNECTPSPLVIYRILLVHVVAHKTIINKKKMSKIFDSNSFKGLTVVIVII